MKGGWNMMLGNMLWFLLIVGLVIALLRKGGGCCGGQDCNSHFNNRQGKEEE